jgi:FHA domain
LIRHRLRFLLQEFDLSPGITLLGRSAECHITIEDPLVSRTHARIERAHDSVTIRDEGSRNGVRVNGELIEGAQRLTHGDRIRIGTQELVFTKVEVGERTGKTTGFLRHCANCRLPYPEEAGACPSCGAQDWADEDTLTGKRQDARTWRLDLYMQLLNRHLQTESAPELEGIWLRASAEVDERIAAGEAPNGALLCSFVELTLRVGVVIQNVMCVCWGLRLLRRAPIVPEASFRSHISPALSMFPLEVAETLREVGAFYEHCGLPDASAWAVEFAALADEIPANAPSYNPDGVM